MHIFVGSTNPVKVNCTTLAASEAWPDVVVKGFDVPSGIPEQPFGDEQTRQGAENRAQRALEHGAIEVGSTAKHMLGVGHEGGVFEYQGELWSTVWVAVTDVDGNTHLANGAKFRVPEPVASAIKNGQEMGPAVNSLLNDQDIRKKQGAIGVVTQGFVDRTEEYTGITKLALGLWYGRNWFAEIQKS